MLPDASSQAPRGRPPLLAAQLPPASSRRLLEHLPPNQQPASPSLPKPTCNPHLLPHSQPKPSPTLSERRRTSDAQEMRNFYQSYYRKYIEALQNVADKADYAQLIKAYQTAAVLLEVLRAVNLTQSLEVDIEILETHNKVEEKKKIYTPFNVLPLDPDSANQAIMRYPEIQAAVNALRSTRGLPWPKDHEKKLDEDLLDWFQAMFGFQKDDVANQREHLILLLANVHIR